MGNLTHIAWDRGVVTEEMTALIAIEFGGTYFQKTTKTQCGKRVKVEKIDNLMSDCPACRNEIVNFARDSLEAFLTFPEDERDDLWQRAVEEARKDIERYGAS